MSLEFKQIDELATLVDWLGTGGVPADEFAARHRSGICESCPMNKKGNWWEGIKTAIAHAIRKQLAMKHRMELTVPNEDRLGTCEVCGCCIPLLVWCPDETLRAHAVEPASAYPDHCWKKKVLTQ